MNNKGSTLVELLILLAVAAVGAILIIAPTIYGLILAFKASIILGMILFILEPSPWIIGVIALFGRADVCQKLTAWLHLPF